jgi:hypothetical protein
MVAERVLDELERELSLLLAGEAARPAYATVSRTDPGTWAPFVVGYFTLTDGKVALLGHNQLSQDRQLRSRWAVRKWQEVADTLEQNEATKAPAQEPGRQAPEDRGGTPDRKQDRTDSAEQKTNPSPAAPTPQKASNRAAAAPAPAARQRSKKKAPSSGTDIVRKLNRGKEQRPTAASRAEEERGIPSAKASDPLDDYASEFGQ